LKVRVSGEKNDGFFFFPILVFSSILEDFKEYNKGYIS